MESVKWWVKLKAMDILEGGEIGHFGKCIFKCNYINIKSPISNIYMKYSDL